MATAAHRHDHEMPESGAALTGVAISATLHCLAGCGLGEIAGDALGTGLHLSNSPTVGLGLLFGLVGGFALGIVPYRRRGMPFGDAARYAEFVAAVCLRHQLQRLPDAECEGFMAQLTAEALEDDPPLTLDYWRLNIAARKARG